MKYKKLPLALEQQADLIISRGLVVDDKEKLVNILQSVNYYRLSAYWYPFKRPDESLLSGITLEKIWRRYTFDRQLRLLVMDAIERVEIAVRTSMITLFSLKYGAFAYLDISNFSPNYNVSKHKRIFSVLSLLQYMLSIVAPYSEWRCRLEKLLENYNDIPLAPMGFPENWSESLIWKRQKNTS